jgi:branched-chain amino acid transport system substrate-binding protein
MRRPPKPRRRLAAALAPLAAVLLLASSCRVRPIAVGVSLPLTGLDSELGVTARNGLELAVDEVNASGGVRGARLEILVRDDGDEATRAAAVDAELAASGVVAIVGHSTSRAGGLAVADADRRSLPLISPTISSTEFSGRDDYFFRVIGANTRQGEALADYAYRGLGLRRVAAAYESTNRAYTEDVYSAFKRRFEAQGGAVEPPYVFKSSPEFDYRPGLRQLLAAPVEGILSVAGPADNAKLCIALAEIGDARPVLAGMWSMTADLIEFAGRAADRMVLAGVMDPGSPAPAFAAFAAAYRARYAAEPSFASVYAYESLKLLVRALTSAASTDGAALKAALLASGRQIGLQDEWTLDAAGDADRGYMVFAVRAGRFERVY